MGIGSRLADRHLTPVSGLPYAWTAQEDRLEDVVRMTCPGHHEPSRGAPKFRLT